MPKVSIIVPIYNVERYLDECLTSVMNQTLWDIEIICVDDGSTDGSPAIMDGFADMDPRFKVIHKENGGYGTGINRGLAEATGDYVGIVESDDFVDPLMFEVLYDAAIQNDLDIVRSNYYLYWSNPRKEQFFEAYTTDVCDKVFNPLDNHQCFYYPPALWSMLVRRSIITDNNLKLLETPGASYQDTAFSFKLWACADKAMLLHDAFLYYRQDNENSSINQKGKVYLVNGEYEELARWIGEDEGRAHLWPMYAKRKFDAYSWNMDRIASEFRGEYAAACAKEFAADKEAGRIDAAEFSEEALAKLTKLTEDPAGFVYDLENPPAPAKPSFFKRLFGKSK